MDHTKQRLNVGEMKKVIDWLLKDPLLEQVNKNKDRHRLINNYNYFFVEHLGSMVQLDKGTKDRVRKEAMTRINKVYGD